MDEIEQSKMSIHNRLDAETSPYLLQHADNPVNWQPWDEAALQMAREQNKPILLSIGYSACHWCHVMAHESFEDNETAALMNALYVNIKIDREERPDLDKVYQTAHQVLAQRAGGWPLTVFLMPDDHTPFFAGTYFPREPRFGMPGFKDVLQRIHAAYTEQREQIRAQNVALRDVFKRLAPEAPGADVALDERSIHAARRALEQDFDPENGGFRGAPKFPHPASLEFLLRQSQSGDDKPAARMALFTLQRMGERGLYDQLGGGFFRYCVDANWTIPHFEKMLYDNGPLLALYADASVLDTGDLFKRIAIETADWAIRDMQSPEGGFYSTLDADTAGHEGATYTWSPEQMQKAIDEPQLAELIEAHYGFDQQPNFEGTWHLTIHRNVEELATERNRNANEIRQAIDRARDAMFRARNLREQPGRDEKILVSWNALMIRGLARASRRLQRDEFADAATRAVDFINRELWQGNSLSAVYKDGRSRFNAYLDDYAFLIDALIELLQCRWRNEDIDFARQLADTLLDRFEDTENGGFFFTSHDHEALIHRPKPFMDEATPSGNGVAALALIRLGHLLEEPRYLDAAERCLRAGWSAIERTPHAHALMLEALREWLQPVETIILRGEETLMREWKGELERQGRLDRLIFPILADTKELPLSLQTRKPQGSCVAYFCKGFTCSAPIDDRAELLRVSGEETESSG